MQEFNSIKVDVEFEYQLIRDVCINSYEEFVREFWEEVPGFEPVVWNWHMSIMCQELEYVARRVFDNLPIEHNLIFNVPPNTSKSTIASILFQPWTWTIMPRARHIHATHTHDLALDLSNKARSVIRSDKYRKCFPYIQINSDQDSKEYFSNTLGGDRKTCTVGGNSPIGFHAHFIGTDDPIDPKKVLSTALLNTANHFVTEVLPTRKINKEVTVTTLTMQRLHSNDPVNAFLKASRKEGAFPCKLVCLPAEESDNVSPSELRKFYVNGLLDPNRLSRRVLNNFKASLSLYTYSGQFNQCPIPIGGSMFHVTYFNNRTKSAPKDCRRIRYWDRAATQDGGCRTAGVLIAKDKDGIYYVEHVITGQWEPIKRNQIMRSIAIRDRNKYGPNNEPEIWVEREGGSSGRDAWLMIVRAMEGFNIKEDTVKGNKVTRAEPWSAQLAGGNVFLVDDKTWDIQLYVDEHTTFPLGDFKDQVDSSSGAFNILVNTKGKTTFKVFSKRKQGDIKPVVLVCNDRQLIELMIEEPCILVSIDDPMPLSHQEELQHNCQKLVDRSIFHFADLESKDYQSSWEKKIDGYDKLPEEVIITKDIGKKIWNFLLRRRDQNVLTFIFQDYGDNRAISLAYAFCDVMRFSRTVINDFSEESHVEKIAPNKHVYDVMKSSRLLVS